MKHSGHISPYLFGIICITFSLLILTHTRADTVKVFLLGGQSNIAGRADASGLPSTLQSPQDDVLFYYGSSLTTLRPGSGTDFGPEITFGRAIADAFPAELFALIKYGTGGTDLHNDWDPATGGTYATFRSKVNNGLIALTNAGHSFQIIGMLWVQGERDAKIGRTTEQYEADLNEFIGNIRARYGTNLPFFLSRLSSGQTNISASGLTNIRTAQENVAASDPFAYMIDTDGMGLKDDNLHFDATGQIALGRALAQRYINYVQSPTDPSVDAGVSMITWSGEPVQLDPNVASSDMSDLAYVWSADVPNGCTVDFDPGDTDPAPVVTITRPVPGDVITVTLTLSVNHTGSLDPPVQDTMTIYVYDDACLAAINNGLTANSATDFNGDCITGFEDLASMFTMWLNDTRLAAPESVEVATSAPAPVSLRAYYSFDTGLTDASGNDNDLMVAAGTPTITTTPGEYVFGGGALDVDSTTSTQEYLNLISPITFGVSDTWSIAFWARRRPGTDDRSGMVIGNPSNNTDFIWLSNNTSQVQGMRFRSSSNTNANFGGLPDDNLFHHWVLIADGAGNVSAYRDNVALGSVVSVSTFSISSVAHAYNQTAQSMDGQIDELYIFDEAIDATTVNKIYNNLPLTSDSGPVNAGNDVITWSGQEVQLDPHFADGYTPASYTWSSGPFDGVVFSSETAEAPTVTITKPTDNPSTVTLTLTVTDGVGTVELDTMAIEVYDDACEAALGKDATTIDPTDFNRDCITDFTDVAVMLTEWLVDTSLTAPIAK